MNWVNERRSHTGKPVVAFDGKVLRGSYRNDSKNALQMVTAYDAENGLVVSQKPTATKNGEISVVQQMLDVLNLKGSVITLDDVSNQMLAVWALFPTQSHLPKRVNVFLDALQESMHQP